MQGDCEWCETRAALVPVASRNPAAPGGFEWLCSACARLADAERAFAFWWRSSGRVECRRASVDDRLVKHVVMLVTTGGERLLSSGQLVVFAL